jgi:hypothetical protein
MSSSMPQIGRRDDRAASTFATLALPQKTTITGQSTVPKPAVVVSQS